MVDKPLPDYCTSGRSLKSVEGAIIHYFSAKNVDSKNEFSMEACYRLFKDLNRSKPGRQWYMLKEEWPHKRFYASAHILIGRDGEVWKLVDFDREAWHAGSGIMNGITDLNRRTLGIELVGKRGSGFSVEQYNVLAALLIHFEDVYGYPRENIMGHDQVRHAARQAGSDAKNKYDPSGLVDGTGNNFDWWMLGKLMNDIKPNPAGTVGLDQLDEVIEASTQGRTQPPAD